MRLFHRLASPKNTLAERCILFRTRSYTFTNTFSGTLSPPTPDDNKFVDCAVAASADFIVTEDKHFKVLKDIPFPLVNVISMDDFVEILTGTRPKR